MTVPEAVAGRQRSPDRGKEGGSRDVLRKSAIAVSDGYGRRVTRVAVVEDSPGIRVRGGEVDHQMVLARRRVGGWFRLDRPRQPWVRV